MAGLSHTARIKVRSYSTFRPECAAAWARRSHTSSMESSTLHSSEARALSVVVARRRRLLRLRAQAAVPLPARVETFRRTSPMPPPLNEVVAPVRLPAPEAQAVFLPVHRRYPRSCSCSCSTAEPHCRISSNLAVGAVGEAPARQRAAAREAPLQSLDLAR